VLKADGRRVWRYFRNPYQWMMDRMAERLFCRVGTYPIWAWAERSPDLRSTGHLTKGAAGVRIQFYAREDKTLISDFDAWHCVLNVS